MAVSLSVRAAAGAAVSAATAPGFLAARFDRIMVEHGAALARLAACYEADPAERQDLIQEIALAIWMALPRFRGECSERTFVFRIGHNRGLTHRARKRAPIADLGEAEAVPDPRLDPAAEADRQDRHARLMDAVRRLPVGRREVVALRLEGLGNGEIAGVLGLTETAVGVRLHRALRTLRALLGEAGGER